MIIERSVSLQNEEAQARIIGKGGKKRRDIEMVSGTRIRVKGLTVYISAQFEEQIVVAVQLINKSEQHRLAAELPAGAQTEVADSLEGDLKLAAYYTFCDKF